MSGATATLKSSSSCNLHPAHYHESRNKERLRPLELLGQSLHVSLMTRQCLGLVLYVSRNCERVAEKNLWKQNCYLITAGFIPVSKYYRLSPTCSIEVVFFRIFLVRTVGLSSSLSEVISTTVSGNNAYMYYAALYKFLDTDGILIVAAAPWPLRNVYSE